MPNGPLSNVVEQLRQAALAGSESDALVMQEFLRCRSETAFRILVRRHGPMVFGVCRRWLSHLQDAEDAFQAVFLVLAHKAGTIEPPEAVGRWLYGVAVHTARRAKVQRRRRQTQPLPEHAEAQPMRTDPLDWLPILDDELQRLPQQQRLPIVLCDVLGRSRQEAAEELGIAEGTLSSRLARAHARLRKRLLQRGVTPAVGAGVLGTALPLHAEVPLTLAGLTVQACCGPATATISTAAGSLAEGVMQAMFVSKLSKILAVAVLISLLGGLGWGFAAGVMSDGPAEKKSVAAANEAAEPKPAAKLDRFGDPLPPGAVLRLGSERFRHTRSLGGFFPEMSFFPDGKTLACPDGSESLKLFDPETGKVRGCIRAEDRLFLGFLVTPDGKQIYSWGVLREGQDGPTSVAIRVWDAASFRAIKTYPVPGNGHVRALILTEKQKLAVQVDGAVKLWDFEENKEIARAPIVNVKPLTLSLDGTTIAIGSQGAFYLWQWQTKQEPRRFPLDRGQTAEMLAFSPDGATIAVVSSLDRGISLWNVATGKLVRTIFLPRFDLGYSLAFTPDGKQLIAADKGGYSRMSGGAQVWNVESGERVRYLPTPGESAQTVSVSPDGARLAVESYNSIHVWDVKTWKELATGDLGHRSTVAGMACTRQNQLLTASFDQTVRLWDLNDGKPLQKFQCHDWVPSAAISPDGSRVAAITSADELLVWDAATGKTVRQLPGHGWGRCTVAFTPDGKKLLSFGADAFLRITDLTTGKALVEHALRPEGVMVPDADADALERLRFADRLADSAFSPDGRWFILNIIDGLRIFNVATGKEVRKIDTFGGWHTTVEFSADSKYLCAGTTRQGEEMSQHVSIWEIAGGQLTFSTKIAEKGYGKFAFATDGKSFAVAVDQPPRLWVFTQGNEKPLRSIELPNRPRKLAFTPDGKRLVCSFEESDVLVYEVHPAKKE